MDAKRVTFNVCGKHYESSLSVIEAKPDTMLAMLLRRNESHEGEIFLQGDPAMFRWILYYYTTDILVDHETVGVPKEVWDREIEYYSLFSLKEKEEEEESKKRPLVDESHELASLAKKQMAEINAKDDEKAKKRLETYKILLEFMIKSMNKSKNVQTGFSFIGKGKSHKPIEWPLNYPHNLRYIHCDKINKHFQEFKEYAQRIGFEVGKYSYNPNHKGKPSHPLYSTMSTPIKTMHQCITLTISLIKDTGCP